MKSHHIVRFAAILLGCLLAALSAYALDPTLQPGQNFDLSHWYVALPTPLGSTSGTDELSAAQLSTAPYLSAAPYFYTGSDGAMVFYVPSNGSRTSSKAGGSRCELRQEITPGSSTDNWDPGVGTHTMDYSFKVTQLEGSGKTDIGQIHGYSGNGYPLVKMSFQYNASTGTAIYMEQYKQDPASDTDTDYTFPGSFTLNQLITARIQTVGAGSSVTLNLTVNGVTHSVDISKWSGQTCYFKAGNYYQDKTSSPVYYASVSFYSLVLDGAAPPVAAPTFSPGGGTYTSAQSVSLSTTTGGAWISYTTDGSIPSESVGTLYTAPIAVSTNTTLKAMAYATGMTDSPVVSATYTIAPPVAEPTFSPGGGTYTSAQSVSLSTTTSGAWISYTTDGSTPSESVGTLYTAPIAVSTNTTLKAMAYATGMTDSPVVSATYTIAPPVVAPTFSPGGGTYTGAQSVSLSTTTGGASIRYTTDGSIPSESNGTLYTAPIAVSTNTTLKAMAYATGMTDSPVVSASYTITPGTVTAAPTFSPGGGSYASAQSVSITSATGGATIRYTTDGSTPSSSDGTVYAGPVSVSTTTTLKAIAYEAGYSDSAVSSADYVISSSGGSANQFLISGAAVTDSSDDGNVASNTVDGSFSTRWSANGDGQWIQYDLGSSGTISYVKIAWYGGDSRIETFDIQVSSDGVSWMTVFSGQSSGATTGFETYDFADVAGRYVRIVGHENTVNTWNSITETQIWGFGSALGAVATPTFSPAGGTYTSAQSVAISDGTSGATIRYTTDGSVPTETNGQVYSSAVAISATSTLKAVAYLSGYSDSAVASADYVINQGGATYVEVESMTLGSELSIVSDATYSGGAYVDAPSYKNLSAVPSNGRATYSFTAPTAGTYYFWVRVKPYSISNDGKSFWWTANGTWSTSNEWTTSGAGATDTNLRWYLVSSISLSANQTTTFGVAYREGKLEWDTVCLTSDPNYTPSTQ